MSSAMDMVSLVKLVVNLRLPAGDAELAVSYCVMELRGKFRMEMLT